MTIVLFVKLLPTSVMGENVNLNDINKANDNNIRILIMTKC